MHSLMVVQDGKVIYEKYNTDHSADELHILWSATKTFTALAAGFACQDSLLDLHKPMVLYFRPEELPDSAPEQLWRVTPYHLLIMASGWDADIITDRMRGGEQFDPVHELLNYTFRDEPGTAWHYNNNDTYMLGVVISRVTGKSLDEYLNEKLFTPLGITNYYYEKDFLGNNLAALGLHMTTEDMAKVGLFMLQRGEWNGQQLLNREWFTDAMRAQIYQNRPDTTLPATDWQSGYCYQMWKCKKGETVRMDGMWGQYVIIMPEKNAVGVMTTICTDRDTQLESFWSRVYDNL